MGFALREPDPGVSIGARECFCDNWQISWRVDGLNGDLWDFSLEWSHNDLNKFGLGDQFHIGNFLGSNHENYLDLKVNRSKPTSSWKASGKMDNTPSKPGDSGFKGEITVSVEASYISKVVSEFVPGRTITKMFNIPNEFTVTWWRESSREIGGKLVHVAFQTPLPKQQFELRGSSEVDDHIFRYEWSGLPEDLTLRIDSGDYGPENPPVYSADIRKPQDSNGHIRAANVRGVWSGVDVQFKLSKMSRSRWVFGQTDPFLDEDQTFVTNSVNFFGDRTAYSKLHLDNDLFGIEAADIHNRLRALDQKTYKWEVSYAADRSLYEGGSDFVDLKDHNQYAWAIPESGLDRGCNWEYSSGDCP